jgi:hypothetical protein
LAIIGNFRPVAFLPQLGRTIGPSRIAIFITRGRKRARRLLAEQWEKNDRSRHCDDRERFEYFGHCTDPFFSKRGDSTRWNLHPRSACKGDSAHPQPSVAVAIFAASNVPGVTSRGPASAMPEAFLIFAAFGTA